MSKLLKLVQLQLNNHASPEALAANNKFVPGDEPKYGVRMPVLNQLAKEFLYGGFELCEELWHAGMVEEKILAIKILERIAKKDPKRSLKLVEHFAGNTGNWAVCDALGMQALSSIRKTHQEEIFQLAKRFNRSTNLWQRRLSLVLVEWYTRDKTLHSEIIALVKPLEKDHEYYVKKAVTWINKNFEKGK